MSTAIENHIYLVMFGNSQVGKSSTINQILGQKTAAVGIGNGVSCTVDNQIYGPVKFTHNNKEYILELVDGQGFAGEDCAEDEDIV